MTLLHNETDLRIRQLEVGNYGNNCYIVTDPLRNESAIIDAAAEPARILDAVAGTEVLYIITTHGHRDHWDALAETAAALPNATVAALAGDAASLPIPMGLTLNDGDTLQIGSVPVRVIATPGHTPGSACLITGRHLFTGDTLFPGGPGRSASPENLRQEIASITELLYVRPDETIVYPGHGATTTIGASKAEYAIFESKPHPADLQGDVLWLEA